MKNIHMDGDSEAVSRPSFFQMGALKACGTFPEPQARWGQNQARGPNSAESPGPTPSLSPLVSPKHVLCSVPLNSLTL